MSLLKYSCSVSYSVVFSPIPKVAMCSSSVATLQQVPSQLMSPSLVLERVAGTGGVVQLPPGGRGVQGSAPRFPRPDQSTTPNAS